jgi:hypothetical protein
VQRSGGLERLPESGPQAPTRSRPFQTIRMLSATASRKEQPSASPPSLIHDFVRHARTADADRTGRSGRIWMRVRFKIVLTPGGPSG